MHSWTDSKHWEVVDGLAGMSSDDRPAPANDAVESEGWNDSRDGGDPSLTESCLD